MGTTDGPPADWPEGVPFYKWPPYPAKPDGVTIIPFSQFVATGLKADQDDNASDVDQMGLPTVALGVRHDGEKKKRRRRRKAPNGEIVEIPLAWWEEFEEDVKGSRGRYRYDQRETYMDRLAQAWKDFTDKRRFPSHVQAVAQAFGVYLGLVEPNPNGAKTNDKGDSDDDASDDGLDPDEEMNETGELPESKVEEVKGDEGFKHEPETERERALDAFYQDPERTIKLFLTSYAYDKGVYWNESKLHDTPILVEAFLNFLEDNSVLGPSEKSAKHSVAQAKKIAQLAKQEMPHANKVARLFPDTWGKACGEIWEGVIRDWVFGLLPGEPSAATLKAAATTAPATANQALADSAKLPDISEPQTEWSDAGEWGASGGWGPGSGANASWGGEGEDDGDQNWNADEFKAPAPEDLATVWGNLGPSGREQLEALIGPNNLPETYVPLRVESSSRIIGSIVEPTADPADTKGTSFAEIAQQRLARLTMLPSPYSKTAPSVGACVNQPAMHNPPIDESKFGWVGQHDPLTSNITLLVQSDEHFLEPLRAGAGMLLTGIFVQVAEVASLKDDENEAKEARAAGGEPPKKKKKKKNKNTTADLRSWWFFYQMGQAYPTFFAE